LSELGFMIPWSRRHAVLRRESAVIFRAGYKCGDVDQIPRWLFDFRDGEFRWRWSNSLSWRRNRSPSPKYSL